MLVTALLELAVIEALVVLLLIVVLLMLSEPGLSLALSPIL